MDERAEVGKMKLEELNFRRQERPEEEKKREDEQDKIFRAQNRREL